MSSTTQLEFSDPPCWSANHIKPAQSFCLSVSITISHVFSFFSEQVSCIFYKLLKVTEPDFRKQSSFAKDSAKWVQNGPNVMFLVTFESFWIISFVWYWKLKYKIIISSQGTGVFSAQKYSCPPPLISWLMTLWVYEIRLWDLSLWAQ